MTTKLFWDDPYLTGMDTTVTGVDGDTVTLAETIFFAESGGQESDEGTIGGIPVLEARAVGTDIRYVLPEGHGLAAGDAVRVQIDKKRREKLMRLHFAAELVLELVQLERPGIVKTGAHIGAGKARIDFATNENIADLFLPVLTQLSHLVDQDLEIVSAFQDEATQRRYWEIEGFARVACGGTHPRRTGEVGPIVLARKNPGKGSERIEIRLG
ncbi:MAG TPA: alanyl-tRNA editing protein [Coriobacteriia bacterium]